jgi:hypothetical protein
MILIIDGNKEINTAQHGPQPSYDIITYTAYYYSDEKI